MIDGLQVVLFLQPVRALVLRHRRINWPSRSCGKRTSRWFLGRRSGETTLEINRRFNVVDLAGFRFPLLHQLNRRLLHRSLRHLNRRRDRSLDHRLNRRLLHCSLRHLNRRRDRRLDHRLNHRLLHRSLRHLNRRRDRRLDYRLNRRLDRHLASFNLTDGGRDGGRQGGPGVEGRRWSSGRL